MLENQKKSEKLFLNKQELKKGSPVYLRIYHMTKINFLIQFFGFGLYHTSLEIDEFEYSFGSTEDDNSGIYINYKNEEITGISLKGKN